MSQEADLFDLLNFDDLLDNYDSPGIEDSNLRDVWTSKDNYIEHSADALRNFYHSPSHGSGIDDVHHRDLHYSQNFKPTPDTQADKPVISSEIFQAFDQASMYDSIRTLSEPTPDDAIETTTQTDYNLSNSLRAQRQRSSRVAPQKKHHRRPLSSPETFRTLRMVDDSTSSINAFDPFQRWRNSPPDEEHVSPVTIQAAINRPDTPTVGRSVSNERIGARRHRGRRKHRSPKSQTSQDSESTNSSRWSGSSVESSKSLRVPSGISRKSRVQNKGAHKPMDQQSRIFKCTFCCDTFSRRYDWARHEKSLHLNLEEWRCAPFGPVVISDTSARSVCAYCNAFDPTSDHLQTHDYSSCQSRATFRRKDHLVQHLRLVHHLHTTPLIDSWKITFEPIRSRCGFCGHQLTSWEERENHLTAHFKNGLTMENWQGGHDLESSIAARVTDAMPPYLIASESKSIVPFSATSPGAKDHREQMVFGISSTTSPDASHFERSIDTNQPRKTFQQAAENVLPYVDLLSSHLRKYMLDSIGQGIIPTNNMLQQQARKFIYQDEDEWNQTAADNMEWLAAFRRENNS